MNLLVIGHLHQDYLVYSQMLPQVGETILGSQYLEAMGGKGHNQALAACRAGAQVRLLTCVGTEEPVGGHLAHMAEMGIDVSGVKTSHTLPTGKAFITVDAQGSSHITVYAGANHELTAADVRAAATGNYHMALLQTELPEQLTIEIIDILHERGIPVLLHLSPVLELPAETLGKVDILILKEYEAAALAHYPLYTDADAAKASLALHLRYGIKEVGILRKGLQLIYRKGQDCHFLRPPAFEATDTSGAVDVFCGYLGALKAQGVELALALKQSLQAACQKVLSKGAGTDIPEGDRLVFEIREG